MFNVDELLTKWATSTPNSIAFIDEERQVTFAEANVDARKIADVLARSGIARGDLVALALPPYVAWSFSLALNLLGATMLSRSSEIFFPTEIFPDWLIGITPDPNFPSDRTLLFNQDFLEKIKLSPGITRAPGFLSELDPVFLFSTSGTTGTNKYLSADSYYLTEMIKNLWPFEIYVSGRILIFPKFGGYIATVTASKLLFVGKPFINCNVLDARVIQVMQNNSVTGIYGSPAQLVDFLEIVEFEGVAQTNISTIILGGTVPSEPLVERMKRLFSCEIYDAQGSTEGGWIATKELTKSIPSGATIHPEVTLQIVDENDELLSVNDVGRIRYHRPGMSTAYYKNPVATSEFFKDGFFYPGDLGFINEQGLLVLAGRAIEIINLGGVKINPQDIEKVAIAQTGVSDCACFAVLGAAGIEELAIALVVDSSFDRDRFMSAMNQKSLVRVALLITVPAIPRNPGGKIIRAQLATQFATEIAQLQDTTGA